MTERVRVGLLLAQQLLHREIEVGNEPQEALEAASKWITAQVRNSDRRKKRR